MTQPADVIATEPTPALQSAPPKRRFLAFLGKPKDPVAPMASPETVEAPETQIATAEPLIESAAPGPSMTDAEIAAAGTTDGMQPEPSQKPRLFGFLAKRVPGEVTAPEVSVVVAAAPVTQEPVARRRGLFGQRNAEATGPMLAAFSPPEVQVASGPIVGLPFGRLAKVCGVSPRQLGTEVARSEGAGTYKLYDSDPSSIKLRPQFITGFKDNCARQFDGALALFGTSAVHEATRYNPLNTNPFTATDTAYETVKVSLCRVKRGVACPDNKADKLARKSAFVSVYRGFGSSGDWLEMFLHNGEVVAYESRSN